MGEAIRYGVLLGPDNGGWGVGMAILTNERGSIGAGAITMQRRLDGLAAIADGGLGPVERQRLARLLSDGRALQLLGQRQGAGASVASSLTKLGITELMFGAGVLRADVGGAAALMEGPSSAPLVAAPGGRIAGGTSQIQRNIIGERILGLPKEPAPDA